MTTDEKTLFVKLLKESGLEEYLIELEAVARVGRSPADLRELDAASRKHGDWVGKNTAKRGRNVPD